jgi:hypothetical protein
VKLISSLLVLFFLLCLPRQLYAQITICRLVKGGNQIELLYIYSDKKKMNIVREKEEALHCYNCNRQFYLVSPKGLKSISNYIDANCKSSPNLLGKFGDDNYEIATRHGSLHSCRLDNKSGKLFLGCLKTWIEQQASLSKDCKEIVVSLQERFIKP